LPHPQKFFDAAQNAWERLRRLEYPARKILPPVITGRCSLDAQPATVDVELIVSLPKSASSEFCV